MVSILIISCKFNFNQSCNVCQALTKIARFWLLTFVFLPACDRIQLPYLARRLALEISTRLDSSGCVELLQRLQLLINSLNDQKRKIIKPIWMRKAYSVLKCYFFVCYDLQSNVTVFFWFSLYRKYKEETEGFQKQLNTSLHVVLVSSNFHQLQIEILVSQTCTWNCGMQSLATHQEHGNMCITTITFSSCNLIFFFNNCSIKNNETKAMQH